MRNLVQNFKIFNNNLNFNPIYKYNISLTFLKFYITLCPNLMLIKNIVIVDVRYFIIDK